jgi:hypothetical protein
MPDRIDPEQLIHDLQGRPHTLSNGRVAGEYHRQ